MFSQQKRKHYVRPTYCSQTLNPQIEVLPPPENFQLNNDYVFIQATKIKQKLKSINTKNYSTLSNSFKYSSLDIQNRQRNKNNKNLSLNIKDIQNESQKQKQSKNVYLEEGKLLKRVTIHRIRSQRDSIQKETKKIQNTFNYITHAIAKKQKLQKLKYQKQTYIYKIRTQKNRNRQICYKQKEDAQKSISKHKMELKQSVIRQKIKTQESVRSIAETNLIKAMKLKQQSQKNQLIIQQRQSRLIQRNKIMYEMEKQHQKVRSQMQKQALDIKRIEARQRFKQKWLSQYQKNNKSRENYKNQKSQIESKLKSILAKYESGQLIQMNRQKDQKNNSYSIGWAKDKNNRAYKNSILSNKEDNTNTKYKKISFFQELN